MIDGNTASGPDDISDEEHMFWEALAEAATLGDDELSAHFEECPAAPGEGCAMCHAYAKRFLRTTPTPEADDE